MFDITALSAPQVSFEQALATLQPLLIFILGVVVYAVFVFKFYKFLARKDVIKLDLQKRGESVFGFIGKIFRVIFYVIEYLLLFPVFVFFWFATFSIIMMVLSRSDNVGNVLLIAMALVAAVRVAAYYNEDLSKDLAKMMPFALLGVFLVDISFFSLDVSFEMFKQLPSMWETILYYFVFVVLLEFTLRILYSIVRLVKPGEPIPAGKKAKK